MRKLWIAVAALIIPAVATTNALAQAPAGRWAASVGVVQTGDGDEPITGSVGFEFAGWYVISEHLDIGVRLASMSFDSPGIEYEEAPSLLPGDGTVAMADLALRWYPLGSDRVVFPFVGVSAGFAFGDSFNADTIRIPDLGIVFDTDWEVDSFGYAAEVGARYDLVGDRWYVEASFRHAVLGAESVGSLEVVPTITRTRSVETNLDGYRIALHFGYYF